MRCPHCCQSVACCRKGTSCLRCGGGFWEGDVLKGASLGAIDKAGVLGVGMVIPCTTVHVTHQKNIYKSSTHSCKMNLIAGGRRPHC